MRMLGHMQLTITINNPNRNPNARPNPKLTQTFAFQSARPHFTHSPSEFGSVYSTRTPVVDYETRYCFVLFVTSGIS